MQSNKVNQDFILFPTIIPPKYLFDYSICYDPVILDQLYLASQTILDEQMVKSLETQINNDPKILNHVISSEFCNKVIDLNPTLATICILTSENTNQQLFCDELLKKATDIQIMEICLQVAKQNGFPSFFLQIYINQCIKHCESLHDPLAKDRIARMVCLFLLSLSKLQKIDLRDFSIECQSFCLQYAKLKEAVTLYKLFKSFE
ncbi:hypothetical protein BC833DRAFT_623816 [Globomyces pollinis-pini]|nr:hypothetical protein BC833DRAFT_623816 [Globomyces pollinis-pini]